MSKEFLELLLASRIAEPIRAAVVGDVVGNLLPGDFVQTIRLTSTAPVCVNAMEFCRDNIAEELNLTSLFSV